eukprot:3371979-Prymnesium_polylepis.2
MPRPTPLGPRAPVRFLRPPFARAPSRARNDGRSHGTHQVRGGDRLRLDDDASMRRAISGRCIRVRRAKLN